jgi:hypothetical protein
MWAAFKSKTGVATQGCPNILRRLSLELFAKRGDGHGGPPYDPSTQPIIFSGNPTRAAPQLPEFLLEECVPHDQLRLDANPELPRLAARLFRAE